MKAGPEFEGEWVSSKQACDHLNIKPATLYAYVSRGRLRTRTLGNDSRKRQYLSADIQALMKSNQRPRSRSAIAAQTLSWGEPVLQTQISSVKDGQLFIGSRSLESWARSYRHADIATQLLGPQRKDTSPVRRFETASGIGALFCELAQYSALFLAGERDLTDREILDLVTISLTGDHSGRPLHEKFARKWGLAAESFEVLRLALICLTEHGLNASTLAVRTAASAGASKPACLLAGLATLSGNGHGGCADRAATAMRSHNSSEADKAALQQIFGHPLYPDGDPRATLLLGAPHIDPRARKRLNAIPSNIAFNVDAGLVAIALSFDLPDGALLEIFCAARAIGWLAHLSEQRRDGQLIRPRAFNPAAEQRAKFTPR